MTQTLRHLLAKYTPGPLKSPLYKHLYRKHGASYVASTTEFAGQRVLIVGPADTAQADLDALPSDSFDVIVKMNNGLFSSFNIGGRASDQCDVLFHSLTDDCRPVSIKDVADRGVHLIVHRTPKRSTFLSTLVAEKRLQKVADVRLIPYERYQEISAELSGSSPTTGMVCLDFFFRSGAAEVAVAGFTLFTTNYVVGYVRSSEKEIDQWQRVRSEGHHDPKSEATLIQERIREARQRGQVVTLAPHVEKALQTIEGFG